jgi:predicted Zn-dependent protease
MKVYLAGVLLFLGLTSCATATLPPIGKEGPFRLEEDENRLWNTAKREQERLDRSGRIYSDPGLLAYLNEVAQKLIPENIKKELSIQIKVVKNPFLNAFAYPHGVIYIHTGFLAKMENEAQLATVLAHEISHVTHRHTVQGFRTVRGSAAVLTTLQVIGAPAGIYGLGTVLLGAIGAMAAVSGYSKALEEEADREGLELMLKAGHDPQEAVTLFERMEKYVAEEKIKEPFFFGTHPRLQDRKDSYNRLLSTYKAKEGFKGTEQFTEKIIPLLLENALLDLSVGRFTLARETVEKYLQSQPDSARGHYLLGEVFRQRGEKGDTERAEKEFNLALQYDPSLPDPYKGLGLIYYKKGEKDKARTQFERYLTFVPDAKDKAYIEQYLRDITENREGL